MPKLTLDEAAYLWRVANPHDWSSRTGEERRALRDAIEEALYESNAGALREFVGPGVDKLDRVAWRMSRAAKEMEDQGYYVRPAVKGPMLRVRDLMKGEAGGAVGLRVSALQARRLRRCLTQTQVADAVGRGAKLLLGPMSPLEWEGFFEQLTRERTAPAKAARGVRSAWDGSKG